MHPHTPLFGGIGRVLHAASLLCVNAAGVLILVIVGISALDMITSFALNRPIPAATNFSEEILPAAIFLSVGMVVRNRADIVVDVLTEQMGGALKKACGVLAAALSFVFFLILGYGAVKLALTSAAIRETAVAAVEFPVWPMKIAFAIGVCMTCLEAARIVFLSFFSVVEIGAVEKNKDI